MSFRTLALASPFSSVLLLGAPAYAQDSMSRNSMSSMKMHAMTRDTMTPHGTSKQSISKHNNMMKSDRMGKMSETDDAKGSDTMRHDAMSSAHTIPTQKADMTKPN